MFKSGGGEALEALVTAQRFEFKYAICEMQAMAIRDYIEAYTSADRHAGPRGDYPVTSLYFDDPALTTYQRSVHGERNRFKIRARAYLSEGKRGVFCEIKRRNHQVLKKHRARIGADDALGLFTRHRTPASVAARMEPTEKHDLYVFRDLMDRVQATPRVMVRYQREARLSNDGVPVRITFDRQLETRPCFHYADSIWDPGRTWFRVSDYDIAMEVKFTESYPRWLDQMVKRFHLRARSICKYVHCVHELKRHGIRVAGIGARAMSA